LKRSQELEKLMPTIRECANGINEIRNLENQLLIDIQKEGR
jgi:hypothetical protein